MSLTGISWPWVGAPQYIYDADVIKNAIRSILFTGHGELKMQPTFGSELIQIVFENIGGPLEALARREIQRALSENLSYATVQKIDIFESDSEDDLVEIIVYYEYLGINDSVSGTIARSIT